MEICEIPSGKCLILNIVNSFGMQELRLVRLNNGNFAESWIKPSTSASLRNLRYNTCADLQQDHGLLFPYGSLHCNIVII
jgi:hypothetical protein